MTARYTDLNEIEYKKAWDYQEELFDKIIRYKSQAGAQNEHPGMHLLFCEHPHVYTLGKNGAENNLLISSDFLKKINATYFQTNRGGDITYHGPGQIVGYPIFDLDMLNLHIREYIFKLEESIIVALRNYKIEGCRLEGAPGVWLDVDNAGKTRKICAIGVKASRKVTMHGFAFNINTDLNYYNYINPCGYTDKGVTSIQKELDEKIDFNQAKLFVKEAISKVFDIEII